MRKYENEVQRIKNQVYREVSQFAFEGSLEKNLLDIPKRLNPGPNASLRCCVYHEREVTKERVQMTLGGNPANNNLIEVLDAACDQCTENRYVVTDSCRGCLSHRCQQSCPVNAMSVINGKAIIDYQKCIECGKCKDACPYDGIADVLRPCIKSCPTGAISMDQHKKAVIDEDKCIRCGACVYMCPFGAMQDKSMLLEVIGGLKDDSTNLYAMIAPAIATQFEYVDLGQVITAMKMMGFKDVIEVALGADLVAVHEADEFVERMKTGDSFMTSSCCPGFVKYIHQEFPELSAYVSSLVSPMVATARIIRSIDPQSKVVFIGPCIAKKGEEQLYSQANEVDYVLTFEELTGMIDAKSYDITSLRSSPLNNASHLGRGFATTGGVGNAIEKILEERDANFQYEIVSCSGISECKKTLTQAKHNRLKHTFIEGMACEGGCIRGPVTMHYGVSDKKKIRAYCNAAMEKSSESALRIFSSQGIKVERR